MNIIKLQNKGNKFDFSCWSFLMLRRICSGVELLMKFYKSSCIACDMVNMTPPQLFILTAGHILSSVIRRQQLLISMGSLPLNP